MPYKIVHFSITGLAGGPYRLSSAINRHTEHDVRLVDLKRSKKFWTDLAFEDDQELCIEIANKADIIHFHNYLDLDSTEFYPINFRELWNSGTKFIRHFRSEPGSVARRMGTSIEKVINCPIPSVVIGQYPERFYPNAKVVRNNLPMYEPAYNYNGVMLDTDIIFTPTRIKPVIETRWGTKGKPETLRMLSNIKKSEGCRVKVISKKSVEYVMKQKQCSYMVLDDMVTGSYHISALEGVSLGKPTICYIDKRIENVLREITGSDSNPFINVNIDNAEPVIKNLLQDRELGYLIGTAGRIWLEKYWDEISIAKEFESIYTDLLEDPSKIKRQTSLRLENEVEKYFAINLPNIEYNWRAQKLWPFYRRIPRKIVNLNNKLWNIIKIPLRRIRKLFKSKK